MIEVAVVGAGHWGPNLIRNFENHTRSRVRWIVDIDRERLQAAQARFPGASCTTDFARALADRSVSAMVIATPTSTHAELTRAALESGRHVLVEKPLTTEAASARELNELAERSGLVLLVGHVFVHNPAVQWVKKRLAAGELGRLYYASSSRTNLGPIRTDVNVSWDLAAQDIAIFDYWLGTTPVSVSAQGHSWLNGGNPTDVASANNDPLTGVCPRAGDGAFRFVAQRADASGRREPVVLSIPLPAPEGEPTGGVQSRVVLYHGSFEALSQLGPGFDWRAEAWETLTHELRHHLEWRAGAPDLEAFDEAAEQNFARQEGEPFDPLFHLQAEQVAEGIFRVDDDWFLDRVLPDPPSVLDFAWHGQRYRAVLPAGLSLPAFVVVTSGVAEPPPGDLVLVLRRRASLMDLFRRAVPPRRCSAAP